MQRVAAGSSRAPSPIRPGPGFDRIDACGMVPCLSRGESHAIVTGDQTRDCEALAARGRRLGPRDMAKRQLAPIKPELLRWARDTAGVSLEAAADKLKVKPEQLAGWEAGDLLPTVPQLRKAADVYKRPLALFFLPAPPSQPELPHDFRRLPGIEVPPLSPELLREMRRARRRRAIALELLTDLGLPVPEFPLHAALGDDPEALAARRREWLGVTIADQGGWRTEYQPMAGWVTALEARGVLVFQTGEVELDEMRGFSVTARELPAIVLNAKDAPRGRIFTLMHEFCHLMLHQAGVCDPARVGREGRSPDENVEVFCNRVAGALLVPRDALLEDPRVQGAPDTLEWDDEVIRGLATDFAVSREVVLRRLLILGKTTGDFYERKRAEYLAQYAERATAARKNEGFAPPSRLALRDNGRRYTGLVLEALRRERITPADASDYLGVRLKHLDEMAKAVRGPAAMMCGFGGRLEGLVYGD